MKAVSYYKEEFGHDLLRFSSATSDNTLSIVCLVPKWGHPGPLGDPADKFQELENKTRFLFCFFFSALLDQAIHSSLREEHAHFNWSSYPN